MAGASQQPGGEGRGGEGRSWILSVNQLACLAISQMGCGRAADCLVTAANTAVVMGMFHQPTG